MSLFEKPKVAGEAGDFWPGREGSFCGVLTGFSEGPVFKNNKKQPDGSTIEVDAPQVRWEFDIYKLDGVTRVQYTPDGSDDQKPASKDALSSTVISNKSKAGEWFTAVLQREIDFTTETAEDLMDEAVGKKCMLVMTKNGNDRVVIKTVARIDD